MKKSTLGQIYDYIDGHFDEHLAATQRYLRQPSVSAQNVGIKECAAMTADMLRRLGAEARLETLEDGHPFVYGHLCCSSCERTLVVYGMYDVQPVEPLQVWQSPPFEANVVGERIVARGSFNSKGPLMAFINAVHSIQAVTDDVPVNMVFVIEGEEELGSPHLSKFIEKHSDQLRTADATYFHMATEMVRGYPQIWLGFKGLAEFELEVQTMHADAHSLVAPVVDNPVWRLIWALNSMRGADERIVIEGFYENVVPPTESDQRLLMDLVDSFGPDAIEALYDIKQFRAGLGGVDFVRELMFGPTLNIQGYLAGYTGPGPKTIVPASAMCKVDIRLVPNMTVQEMLDKVRAHLDLHGYEDIGLRPVSGYSPGKTSEKEAVAEAAIRAARGLGTEPTLVPMLPGSAPLVMFSQPPLRLPFVAAGLGHGSLMHSPNEYIEVEGLRSCEKSAVAFLYEFAEPR